MTYADAVYYKTVYYGVEIEAGELERLLARASEKIDEATFNRSRYFDKLSDYEKEMIQKATCAEAEALHAYGEYDVDLASYSVGDVSISMSNGANGGSGLISKKAYKYLSNTRLTSRILR